MSWSSVTQLVVIIRRWSVKSVEIRAHLTVQLRGHSLKAGFYLGVCVLFMLVSN